MSEVEPTDEGRPELPWASLHPASVVVNLLPRAWGVMRTAWPLLLALLYGGRAGQGAFDLLIVLLFFAMTFGSTIVHWATLRYRVSEGRLEVRTGLLNRQVRVIAPDRIQNTELVRNVFHRMSGLVEVRIETASGREVEGLLSALSVAEAEALTSALERARRAAPPPEEEPPVLLSNSVRDLVWFGTTTTRLGAIAVTLGLGFEAMQVLDPERLATVGPVLGLLGGAALLVGAITGTWLLGTGAAVIRHYGFRLLRRGRTLVAQEGLLTRRNVELPLAKVQVVTVSEPILRRLAGFGTIHIETAAAREAGSGTQRAEAVVPVVDRAALSDIVRVALPDVELDLEHIELHPPHPRALIRAEIGSVVRAALLGTAIAWWLWPWGFLAIGLVPLAMGLAWLDHRHQGWLVTDDFVVSRSGYLNRRTRVVARRKLQSLELVQGVLLRRWGLGRLALRVAGSSVSLPVLGFDDASELQLELLRKLARTPAPEPQGTETPETNQLVVRA